MSRKGVLTVIYLLFCVSCLAAEQKRSLPVVSFRASGSYLPVGSVGFLTRGDRQYFYDSFVFGAAAGFRISEYFSLGPGVEYLTRQINPDVTFCTRIRLIDYFVSGRFSYPLSDSGYSFFVLAVGTGLSRLRERSGAKGEGTYFSGLVALDVGLRPTVGLDFGIRFDVLEIDVEQLRQYRFMGAALHAGINYRLGL